MEELIVKGVKGFIIAGAFGTRGHMGKIFTAKFCRERNVPVLGICLGFQLMVVEICRNVLNLDVHSAEFNESQSANVIVDMPEYKTNQMGGTMRLGKRMTMIKKGS